jgi:hypothetical protein
MRHLLLTTTLLLGLGTAAGLTLTSKAAAEPPATPEMETDTPPPPPPGLEPHHGGPGWFHHHPGAGPFGLIYMAPDRKLTPPDVQKIAEAFLLWHGNHSWKVVDVHPEGELIAFAFATAENSVVARFTINPHNGQIERAG